MTRWLYAVWYERARGGFLLWPLEWLFRVISAIRKRLFQSGTLKSFPVDAHVIVVGNIAVGGAGKSPLTGWLATQLTALGYQVAIVSRGYGGNARGAPQRVSADTDVAISGDEAKMHALATGLAVYVCKDRVAACVRATLDGAQVIVCDDGLQHYALQRDIEIAVVDGERLHGNEHCLPAGPLREPVSRLRGVDLIVYNGGDQEPRFELQISEAVNVRTGECRPLAEFRDQAVIALAGIAHPDRFFAALRLQGLDVTPVSLDDHATATEAQRHPPGQLPVLMTDKDAVKYDDLNERHWRVPAVLVFEDAIAARVLRVATPANAPTGATFND